MKDRPRFPGIRVVANGNQLVSYHTEARICAGGIFYPITPSTEGGELYQQELRAISRRLGNPRLGSRAAGGPSVRVGEGES